MNVNIATAARLLCSLQAKNVLVLGDVMLDRFVDGAVNRISPEAPVPILSQSRIRQMPAGAANLACNLAQMGLRVHLIGALQVKKLYLQMVVLIYCIQVIFIF